MGCSECCGRFCRCCSSCLSRIPYGTAVGIVIMIIGVLMFVSGFVLALKEINQMLHIKGMLDFGNVVAGIIIGIAITLGILVLLFACCSSGDTRENVYSGFKSKLCGKFCSSFLMILEYFLYLAWSLLTVFMVIPLVLQIILNTVCKLTPKCINLEQLGLTAILKTVSNSTINNEICADDLKKFCNNVNDVGTPLLVSVIGAFIAALGTVHLLMCLSANFAYIKSFQKVAKGEQKREHIPM